KSNEPLLLEASGEQINEWKPEEYGIPGSFGAYVVNPDFARDHPQAVQDYLRAVLKAYAYCQDHGAECVGYTAERAESGYDVAHNEQVWDVERGLVADSTPKDQPIGYIDTTKSAAEGETLIASGELSKLPDIASAFDTSYLEAVYDGTELIWP